MTMQSSNLDGRVARSVSYPSITARRLSPVEQVVSAFVSWWGYRARPPNIPANLLADLGLPPEPDSAKWWDLPPNGAPRVWRRPDHE